MRFGRFRGAATFRTGALEAQRTGGVVLELTLWAGPAALELVLVRVVCLLLSLGAPISQFLTQVALHAFGIIPVETLLVRTLPVAPGLLENNVTDLYLFVISTWRFLDAPLARRALLLVFFRLLKQFTEPTCCTRVTVRHTVFAVRRVVHREVSNRIIRNIKKRGGVDTALTAGLRVRRPAEGRSDPRRRRDACHHWIHRRCVLPALPDWPVLLRHADEARVHGRSNATNLTLGSI